MTKQIKLEDGSIHQFPDDATDEEINSILSSNSSSEKPNTSMMSSLLQKLGDSAGKFNEAVESTRLPSMAGGLLQGAADTGISLANLPLERFGKSIPHPDLGKYLPQDSLSRMAFMGGEIGGSLPIAGGAYKAVSKVTPNLIGKTKLIGDALRGAAVGYGTGEEAPGGRAGGAAIGGILPTISNLLPSNIANSIVKTKNEAKETYNNFYNNLFKKADEAGIKNVKVPETDFSRIIKKLPNEYNESVKKFLENPTPRLAHDAQSDLGKYYNEMQSVKKSLSSAKRNTITAAGKAQKAIINAIHESLGNADKKLSTNYKDITSGYKKEVVPFLNHSIKQFESNKLKPGNLVKKLNNNDEFMLSGGKMFPALQASKILDHPVSKILLGSMLGGAGIKEGHDLFSAFKGQ